MIARRRTAVACAPECEIRVGIVVAGDPDRRAAGFPLVAAPRLAARLAGCGRDENPIVRDAFFPSGSDELTIEPARAPDRAAITAISAAQQGPEATALVEAWWRSAPDAFRVARDAAGVVQGFSSLWQPQDVSRSLLRSDPVTAVWMER